jgi:hypothetical protein
MQRVHAEDESFEPNDVITRKTFMDGLFPRPERKSKEVVGPDRYLLKSHGEGSFNLQIELLEIKRSDGNLSMPSGG